MISTDRDDRIERIRLLKNAWIRYTRAEQILDELEELLQEPKSLRMQNLLLYGEPTNGKSTLLDRFVKRHKAKLDPAENASQVPVVMFEVPSFPDEGKLYFAILKKLNAPFPTAGRLEKRQEQVFHLLELVGVRMLIIDEIHNFLVGTQSKRQGLRDTIKYIGNQLQVPIVAAGTPVAMTVFHSDSQLRTRFKPVELRRWTLDEEYLRLLAAFESALQLEEPSNLTEEKLAAKILSMADGRIGEVSNLLRAAALNAIRTGKERITSSILDSCGFLPISRY